MEREVKLDGKVPDTNFWLVAFPKKQAFLSAVSREVALKFSGIVDISKIPKLSEVIEAHVQQYEGFFVLKIACDDLHKAFLEHAFSVFRVGDNTLVNVKHSKSRDADKAVSRAYLNTFHKFLLMRPE